MKRTKRLLALLLVLMMAVSLFAGCAQTDKPAETPQQGTEQTSTPTVPDETQEPEAPTTREITDMAGRTVTVPAAEEIESIFSTGPVSAIFLYMVAPDKMLGWNYELNDIEKAIILEEYHDIPNFGMGDAVNYEAVIAANPTIAVNCGTINDAMISDCDALSEKLGIPVIAVDSDLNNSAAAFRFMGELLGVEEHCEQLAAYTEQTFADIAKLADIPEDERVRVYYGNGEDSLETAPNGSSHAQILDTINAINVADLELGDGSRVQISAEQLLAWDPDVIVVNGEPKANMSGGSAADAILSNPDYASLKAVQDLKVYGTPNAPFSWVDRPPGPNRLIGMRWFSALIYSDYIDCDVNEEVHKFFELFYHIDLTDEQMENLLKGTL
jgi:iron complex transport system substrate-binding protein